MTRADNPRFTPRERTQPRRVRNGLKLRRKDGFAGVPWPASTLIKLVDDSCDPAAKEEGLTYATSGQVASLIIEPAVVEAVVQGRAPQPYRTLISFKPFDGEAWNRLIEAMAAEAVYPARLLAGEMPSEVEALARSLGLVLLPAGQGDPAVTCTCSETQMCKHAAAVLYHVAERLSLDPRLVFTLRGVRAEHVVMRLQEARSIRTQGVSSAHSVPASSRRGDPRPLETCLADFWRPGPQLESVENDESAFAPHALLRRLGPSPLGGRFPLVGLLASIYDTVRDEAMRIGGATTDAESGDQAG